MSTSTKSHSATRSSLQANWKKRLTACSNDPQLAVVHALRIPGSVPPVQSAGPYRGGENHVFPENWSTPLRWIGWILALLLLVGWIATDLPPLVSPAESMTTDLWRRTRNGWERAEWLLPETAPTPLWLHPGVLATLQIAASVTAFTLFCRGLHGPKPASVGSDASRCSPVPNRRRTVRLLHAGPDHHVQQPRMSSGVVD